MPVDRDEKGRWAPPDHTLVKHAIIKTYLGAWLPILASEKGAVRCLAYIDPFAGPGLYPDDNGNPTIPGSPVIALRALFEHPQLEKIEKKKLIFVFVEKDKAAYESLEAAVGAEFSNPAVVIKSYHGSFSEKFPKILGLFPAELRPWCAVFAFIDPFGYTLDFDAVRFKYECARGQLADDCHH